MTRSSSMDPDPNDGSGAGDEPEQQGRLVKSASVFGVDQIWEKEMAKLKAMQEAQAGAAAALASQTAESDTKKGKGKFRIPGFRRSESAYEVTQLVLEPETNTVQSPRKVAWSPGNAMVKLAEPEVADFGLPGGGAWGGDGAVHIRPEPEKMSESSDEEGNVPLSEIAKKIKVRQASLDTLEGKTPSVTYQAALSPTGNLNGVLETLNDDDDNIPLSHLRLQVKASKTDSDDEDDVPLSVLRDKVKGVQTAFFTSPTAMFAGPVSKLGLTNASMGSFKTVKAPGPPAQDLDDIPLGQRFALGQHQSISAPIDDDDIPLGFRFLQNPPQQHTLADPVSSAQQWLASAGAHMSYFDPPRPVSRAQSGYFPPFPPFPSGFPRLPSPAPVFPPAGPPLMNRRSFGLDEATFEAMMESIQREADMRNELAAREIDSWRNGVMPGSDLSGGTSSRDTRDATGTTSSSRDAE
jgi:hypothetical protein